MCLKSMLTSHHGAFGSGDMMYIMVVSQILEQYIGVHWSTHWFIICVTRESMPENHTFSLMSCFVFTIPWCPSWAICTIRFCNALGITNRVPLSSTFSSLFIESSSLINLMLLNASLSQSSTCVSIVGHELFLIALKIIGNSESLLVSVWISSNTPIWEQFQIPQSWHNLPQS